MENRSSLLLSKNSDALHYPRFDPGGSIDSELSNSRDNKTSRANGFGHAAVVEDARQGKGSVQLLTKHSGIC